MFLSNTEFILKDQRIQKQCGKYMSIKPAVGYTISSFEFEQIESKPTPILNQRLNILSALPHHYISMPQSADRRADLCAN